MDELASNHPHDPDEEDLLRAWADVGFEDLQRFLAVHAAVEQALRDLREDDPWR